MLTPELNAAVVAALSTAEAAISALAPSQGNDPLKVKQLLSQLAQDKRRFGFVEPPAAPEPASTAAKS